MKRVIAFILVIAFALTAFAGCSKKSPTVMKVGGFDVSYDLLRYFALNYMNGYEGLTQEDFKTNAELSEKLRENVIKSISELAAYKLLADEYKLELTETEKNSIKASLDQVRSEYATEEEYQKALKDNYVTEDVLKQIYEIQAKCDRLYEYMTNEYYGKFKSDTPTIEADIAAGNWFAAEYICVSYNGASEYQSRKEFASSLRESVVNGEKTLAGIYEEYRTQYGIGINYCKIDAFTYSQEKKYFEEAVIALEPYEISELIESEDGFVIIRRLEIDEDYIDKQFISVFVAGYLEREFFKYIDEYASKLEIKINRKYKDLKFEDIT